MPDFQILKITLSSAVGEQVYIRRETVGSATLGGNLNPPYPKEKISNRHLEFVKRKGNKATRFDIAAANAKDISVSVLPIEGLENVTARDADQAKAEVIRRFKEENPGWKEQLLNGRLAKYK